MAIKSASLAVVYYAWDGGNSAGKTGDVANHTLKLIQDGAEAAFSTAASEVDATNCPGLYKTTLSALEMGYNCVTLHGVSSTADISLIPLSIITEQGNLATIDGIVDSVLLDTGTDGVVLAASAVTSAKIASGAITSGTFASGALTADAIAASAIGASELAVGALNAISDGVWDELLTGHTTASTAGETLNHATTLGAGATTWTYTVTYNGVGLSDVQVWVTSDLAGSTVIASGTTNSSGVVTFYLDSGATVYVWCQRDAYSFSNPDQELVSA